MTYKLNARHLVLDLLYASQNSTASIKQMLCAADLLSISHNSLRVAVARLNQENIIQAVERGVYQLLEKKFDTSFISLNKHPNMQMATAWNGKYVLVYTGALGRVDRTALSKREKALGYYGFQEMEQNVFIRPDNLMLSLTELKTAAIQFGLDPDARFFQVSQLESETEVRDLWDIEELHQTYHAVQRDINDWFENYQNLTLADAAKSAFYLGKSALFSLRADPLLPAEWIDTDARQQFELAVRKIEKQGQLLWQHYFKDQGV
nr:PaaX family transcriptional regulator C-terminal domain-containing protein [Acinetobacter lwoffii]